MMKHRLIEQLKQDPMHLTELARDYGDKPAVVMAGSGATLSYAELDRQSNKIAGLFRSRGLRPGDHIAVLMENRPEFFPVVWAAQRSGLLYTPVNWHLSAAEASLRRGRLRCPSAGGLQWPGGAGGGRRPRRRRPCGTG